MAPTDRELRRDAIRRTLALRAGSAPGASATAAALLGTWHEMAARLAPVIGAQGVDVLLSRALHLTRAAVPELGVSRGGDSPLAVFSAHLRCFDAAAATDAAEVLLVTFTELLGTLIGDSLTDRLLGSVWAASPPALEQEKPRHE